MNPTPHDWILRHRYTVSLGVLAATAWLAVSLAQAEPASSMEAAVLRDDLIGHTMGGRERAWHFQGPEQIHDLQIESVEQGDDERCVRFTCTLRDERVPGGFAATAQADYRQEDGAWVLRTVGLLSMRKVE